MEFQQTGTAHIMPQVNKRFFAFGCSATRSAWPTWADILGRQFSQYENWGRAGSGNMFIFNSIIECNQRNTFTPDDLVIVMWSSTCREDRYVARKGGWIGQGNIYNQTTYTPAWVKEFSCDQGYLIRDLALISAASNLLDQYKIPHEFLSTNNLNTINESNKEIQSDALELYSDIVAKVKPGIWDIIYQGDLTSRNNDLKRKQFLWYEDYISLAGSEWPAFEDFLLGNYACSNAVQRELNRFVKDHSAFPTHNLPHEYLEYLDIVLPNSVETATREWVDNLRRSYKQEEKFYYNNIPKRFNINL